MTPKDLHQFGAYAPDTLYGIATVSILFGCGCLIYHKCKRGIDSQYRLEGKSDTPAPASETPLDDYIDYEEVE